MKKQQTRSKREGGSFSTFLSIMFKNNLSDKLHSSGGLNGFPDRLYTTLKSDTSCSQVHPASADDQEHRYSLICLELWEKKENRRVVSQIKNLHESNGRHSIRQRRQTFYGTFGCLATPASDCHTRGQGSSSVCV